MLSLCLFLRDFNGLEKLIVEQLVSDLIRVWKTCVFKLLGRAEAAAITESFHDILFVLFLRLFLPGLEVVGVDGSLGRGNLLCGAFGLFLFTVRLSHLIIGPKPF